MAEANNLPNRAEANNLPNRAKIELNAYIECVGLNALSQTLKNEKVETLEDYNA